MRKKDVAYKGSLKGMEQLHRKGLVTIEHIQLRALGNNYPDEYAQYLLIRCKGHKEIMIPYLRIDKGEERLGYSALHKEQFILEEDK